MDRVNESQYSKQELSDIAKDLGLDCEGTKYELCQRINQILEMVNEGQRAEEKQITERKERYKSPETRLTEAMEAVEANAPFLDEKQIEDLVHSIVIDLLINYPDGVNKRGFP